MSTLRSSLFVILAILIALGAIEGIAWWWMHPVPTGLGQPVLAYRPVGRDPARSAHLSPAARDDHDQHPADSGHETVPALPQDPSQSSSPNQKSEINNHQSEISPSSSPIPNLQSPISNHSSFTPLPELVSRAMPSLRCSTGAAARIDREDGITVHVAFFEWDLASSINVLEAFKHLPKECMGSIGMTLVKTHPPRKYEVRDQGPGSVGLDRRAGPLVASGVESRGDAAGRAQESVGLDRRAGPLVASGVGSRGDAAGRAQETAAATDHRSLLTDHSISFDHTEFRDPVGRPVHAFKGVWVSGAANLLGDGLRGGGEQWRQIRFHAALKRFRPAHARVAQGAILGIANPDRAWEIFEESMLHDLAFQR